MIGSDPIAKCDLEVFRILTDRKEQTVTFTHALHMPTLNANLVSVSALDSTGLTTIFGGGKGVTKKLDGTIILVGQKVNRMYLLEALENLVNIPVAMTSLSHPTSLEQWHRRLTHCSPATIQDMASKNLVDGLDISEMAADGQCENCILGHQTHRPFDGETQKDLDTLELIAFDLWGLSHMQSAGGKIYIMLIVDTGTSYKSGSYLPDTSDTTTIPTFDNFHTTAEISTGKKICQLHTDGAYDLTAWREYCQCYGITHELMALYSSAQNKLAERAIRTTIDNVCTLLNDSGLGHFYWAKAAAYSVDTRNLVPSQQHPGRIPAESFSGKRQDIAHLHIFGARCWAKIPTAQGNSKLDPHSVECQFLGYTSRAGNYKVQDVVTCHVFILRDLIFEEGQAQ